MQNPLIVAHPDHLQNVSQARDPTRVVLKLSMLIPRDAARWESKLNSAIGACGCEEATAFLLITVGAISAAAYFHCPFVPRGMIHLIPLTLCLAIASILVGKSYGKLRARRRLKRTIDQLRIALEGDGATNQ
jgi:hypothetical protein